MRSVICESYYGNLKYFSNAYYCNSVKNLAHVFRKKKFTWTLRKCSYTFTTYVEECLLLFYGWRTLCQAKSRDRTAWVISCAQENISPPDKNPQRHLAQGTVVCKFKSSSLPDHCWRSSKGKEWILAHLLLHHAQKWPIHGILYHWGGSLLQIG